MDIHEINENQTNPNPTMDFNGRLKYRIIVLGLEAHHGNQPYNDRNPMMETDPRMVDSGTGLHVGHLGGKPG